MRTYLRQLRRSRVMRTYLRQLRRSRVMRRSRVIFDRHRPSVVDLRCPPAAVARSEALCTNRPYSVDLRSALKQTRRSRVVLGASQICADLHSGARKRGFRVFPREYAPISGLPVRGGRTAPIWGVFCQTRRFGVIPQNLRRSWTYSFVFCTASVRCQASMWHASNARCRVRSDGRT